MEQLTLEIQVVGPPTPSPNPMVRIYGPGPEGRQCRECRFMEANVHSRTYWKCGKRRNTNGPATDHRRRWPGCRLFEGEDNAQSEA
jgi:hypothetical protein